MKQTPWRGDVALLLAATFLLIAVQGGSPAMAEIRKHARYEIDPPSPFDAARNLFLKAKVKASGALEGKAPQLAVDGHPEDPNKFWAADGSEAWLTVDLGKSKPLNAIRLWTHWDGSRYYQYVIEGSKSGRKWFPLADQSGNTAPATSDGQAFAFPEKEARYIRVTFSKNSTSGETSGGHIVEMEGYKLNKKAFAALEQGLTEWASVAPGLHAAFGSVDTRYARDDAPEPLTATSWAGTAWRGERVHGQALIWTAEGAEQVRLDVEPLKNPSGKALPAEAVTFQFVRYAMADGKLMPDIVDTAARLDLRPRTARPAWLSVDVPADVAPGVYKGRVVVAAAGGARIPLDVQVEVLPNVLPAPAEWQFRLDLWQNPYALARYHGVEPWSEAHWRVLEPHLRMLAEAGQKCITTSIVHDPWHSQTYDPYGAMVDWVKKADGSWAFDFSIFDAYVAFAMQCGITDSISCYSMVPWSNSFRYLDEASCDYQWVKAMPGSPEHDAHWRPFLKAFVAHLAKKGWLEKTAIAMDERPPEQMIPAIKLVNEAGSGLRIALAGGNHPELNKDVYDWCVFIHPPLDTEIARERTERDVPTTFYVCCGPGTPNTFTFSPPAESTWLGWYAAAQDYSGFLRWAYDSFVEDPLLETSFVTWPAGDCFLVYPGPRTSIRFERLREGIQDYEKVRLVREALMPRSDNAARDALDKLDEALSAFTFEAVKDAEAAIAVNAAKQALEDAARVAGK